MMEGLQQAVNQFSNDTRNKMKMLTGGNKGPRPLLNLNEWTSEVIGIDEFNKNDKEDGHQEDDDHQEDDSDEDHKEDDDDDDDHQEDSDDDDLI
jgi:hypothetical protein